MIHRDLNELDPEFGALVLKAIQKMNEDPVLKKHGVEKVGISETYREPLVHLAYYSRGRMPPEYVIEIYQKLGLGKLTIQEAVRPVTWTLDSMHMKKLAVDILFLYKDGVAWWIAPREVLLRMGEIGESCGLYWLGRDNPNDSWHFQAYKT